jgi:hypothetical protein
MVDEMVVVMRMLEVMLIQVGGLVLMNGHWLIGLSFLLDCNGWTNQAKLSGILTTAPYFFNFLCFSCTFPVRPFALDTVPVLKHLLSGYTQLKQMEMYFDKQRDSSYQVQI